MRNSETDPQRNYIRRLRNQCSARRIQIGYVWDFSRTHSKSEASNEIQYLLSLLA